MNFPPMVNGVTEQSTRSPMGGLGTLLQTLLFSDGGGGESSLAYIQEAISLLEKAAKNDPRIAPRVTKALEVLENSDAEEGGRDTSSLRSPRVSAMFGGMQSPV